MMYFSDSTSLRQVLALSILVAASIANAQDTRFAQTYTWLQEGKGEHELEVKMTRVDRDTWLSENEFEIGVTDRLTIAPYLNFEFQKSSPTLGGWALETRYKFGEFKSRTLLPAIYIEPQQLAGDPAITLEGRIIGSYYTNDSFDTLISGNLIGSRLMQSGEVTNYGYSVGAVKMNPTDWYGAEAYGSWTDKSHFVGPTVGHKLTHSTALILHVGLSMDKQDNQIKLLYTINF